MATGMSRPITERMAEAKARLVGRNRVPRVFFLGPKDYAEFEATNPGAIEAIFSVPLGSKPQPMTCLAFDNIAVRRTDRKPDRGGHVRGALYCCLGTGTSVPLE